LEFNVPFQHKYGYIRDDVGVCQVSAVSSVEAGRDDWKVGLVAGVFD